MGRHASLLADVVANLLVCHMHGCWLVCLRTCLLIGVLARLASCVYLPMCLHVSLPTSVSATCIPVDLLVDMPPCLSAYLPAYLFAGVPTEVSAC
ncbi:hypothetical protein VNO78_07718 [Psophocarpus tetragonolobus]|uniref:Uncharacterized protein n=1 Tax=Psophocarpus tetragonolobus TaxID=3891 RepID=A0AAN9XT05_PSOTE